MSLESAVERLSAAVERNSQSAAVAEIIRQRDEWQKTAERFARDRDWHKERAESNWKGLQTARRQVAALRGVIARMKKKAELPPAMDC